MSPDLPDAVRLVSDRLGRPAGQARAAPLTAEGSQRRVLRVEWPGEPPVVVKLYEDGSGAGTFEAQRSLAAQVDGRPGPLAIPDPIFCDPGGSVLVQPLAPGETLAARIARGDVAALALAGRAAAALHALRPAAPPRSVHDHVAELMRPHPAALAAAVPALSARIEAVLAGLERAVAAHSAPTAPLHRDLHPRQIIVDGGRAWLVDWDLTAAGDPALDVGNLLAWLETHLSQEEAGACRERFLAGYEETGDAAALERVDAYRALTYMRLACKRFRRGADVATGVAPMLDGAEAALAAARPRRPGPGSSQITRPAGP
jgi:streptomycin 6-kinase